MNAGGQDRLLVTGLGPVGLAAAQLGKVLGVSEVVGVDVTEARLEIARKTEYIPGIPLVDHVLHSDSEALERVHRLTEGKGCEVSIDCSGSAAGRLFALQGTRQWGRCGFVGEGGSVEFDVSPLLIHKQITLYGSWVTSKKHMADLAEVLGRRQIHPESTCGPKLPLAEAQRAYQLADEGQSAKVCIVFDD
jgi:threonine dehydrogenase-like Zn-dependent dehydrogenase